MLRKMKEWEWSRSKINLLKLKRVELEKIVETNPEFVYTANPLTVWKLVSLFFYMDVYTRVMSGSIPKHFDEIHYIDVLSGSGINKINGDYFFGSPFIATMFPFNYMHFVEELQLRSGSLNKLLDSFGVDKSKFKIYNKNCNDIIDDLLEKIPNRAHSLVFVDNEGLNVNWSTMEKLFKIKSDLIINFQTKEIPRVVGRSVSFSQQDENKLTLFFGDDIWKQAKVKEDLLKIYIKKISQYRDLIEVIPIRSGERGGYFYDLIFVTKKTTTGSKWFYDLMAYLKNRLTKRTGKDVKIVLDILSGKIKTLDEFKKTTSIKDYFKK